MKRICTALLALLLLLGGAVAEEDIFAVNISPTPTVETTPGVPSLRLGISEYTYAVWENTTLGVRFAYPSHWEQTPGRRSICYEEPVGEGEVPARMVVSVKQLDDRADEDEMKYLHQHLFWRVDKLKAGPGELPCEGDELWIRIPPDKVYLVSR